jgi:hypothetical protein
MLSLVVVEVHRWLLVVVEAVVVVEVEADVDVERVEDAVREEFEKSGMEWLLKSDDDGMYATPKQVSRSKGDTRVNETHLKKS